MNAERDREGKKKGKEDDRSPAGFLERSYQNIKAVLDYVEKTKIRIISHQLGALPRIPQNCSASNVAALFFFQRSLYAE